jgi:hypothetical protein
MGAGAFCFHRSRIGNDADSTKARAINLSKMPLKKKRPGSSSFAASASLANESNADESIRLNLGGSPGTSLASPNTESTSQPLSIVEPAITGTKLVLHGPVESPLRQYMPSKIVLSSAQSAQSNAAGSSSATNSSMGGKIMLQAEAVDTPSFASVSATPGPSSDSGAHASSSKILLSSPHDRGAAGGGIIRISDAGTGSAGGFSADAKKLTPSRDAAAAGVSAAWTTINPAYSGSLGPRSDDPDDDESDEE